MASRRTPQHGRNYNLHYNMLGHAEEAFTHDSSDEPRREDSVHPQHGHLKKRLIDSMFSWASALMTVALLTLTAAYSSRTTAASNFRFLYSSSTNTIFVLSLLSGATGIFLATTIACAFERVQWLFISQKDGVRLSKYLSLQAGTGFMGLLVLSFGRGRPLFSSTRLWSLGRLCSIAVIPFLGVLIMSNVNTREVFYPIHDSALSSGWGMSRFNASLAKNVSAIADQLIQAQLTMFLSDPTRSVDITPPSLREIPCSRGPGRIAQKNCRRTYFMPGGIELAAPPSYRTENAGADAYLAKGQLGYILEFVEGPEMAETWSFEAEDCEVYGFPFGGFYLCLKNVAENSLHVRIVHCPGTTSMLSLCQSNTTWYADEGWTTSLTSYFQRSDTAYSTSNGTILGYEFSTDPRSPAPIDAAEMLEGFRSAFSSFPDISSLLKLIGRPESINLFPLYVYPAIVWANLKGVLTLGQQNPAIITRAQDTLECLLAIMMYYCQPSLFARALSPYAENSTLGDSSPELRDFAKDLLATAPRETPVYPATRKFELVVGRETLIIYITLSGGSLLLSMLALLWSFCGKDSSRIPQGSLFPAWDDRFKCTIEGEEVLRISEERVKTSSGIAKEADRLNLTLK